MHNKAMVVDNRVAIVGGRNIGDEYFGLDEGANFRDLELILGGATVRRISEAFDDYWNDRWSFPIDAVARSVGSEAQLAAARDVVDASLRLHEEETPEERLREWLALIETADAGDTVLFVDDPPGDNPKNRDEFPVQVASELVRLFDRATSEIVIISAYLIPTPDLEGAVERALRRGVRVRILTNSIASNNHVSAHGAYRNHVEGLLDDGAELHEVRTEARDRGRYMLSPVGGKSLALAALARH